MQPAVQAPRDAGRLSTVDIDCLTENQILEFLEGRLQKAELATVDTHLNACTVCAALVVEMLQTSNDRTSAGLADRACGWTFDANTQVAGRYVIVRPIAHGGMGEVYEAYDLYGAAPRALKTTLVTECDEPERGRRLLSEFELARRVCSTNVCRAHDAGIHRDEGRDGAELAYICMDLIPGRSLAWQLRRRIFAPDSVLGMARQLLGGVSAIHQAGVIHRDIKSSNVMLRDDAESTLVIIDFGLAIDGGTSSSGRAHGVSASAFAREGSLAYMAPEQFRGAPVTPATDIFGCGVVLFEALTGSVPFRSLISPSRWARREPGEVPLRAADLVRDVPAGLDAFLAHCLELDPRRRYASSGEALAMLAQLQG